jgi:hypothetical protein
MLKYVIEKYELQKEFNKYGLSMDYHVELIYEFIIGEGTLLKKNHFLYQVSIFILLLKYITYVKFIYF